MKKRQICPPFDLWLILDIKPKVSLFIAFLVFHLFFSLPLEKLNFKSHFFHSECLSLSCELFSVDFFLNHLALTLGPFKLEL